MDTHNGDWLRENKGQYQGKRVLFAPFGHADPRHGISQLWRVVNTLTDETLVEIIGFGVEATIAFNIEADRLAETMVAESCGIRVIDEHGYFRGRRKLTCGEARSEVEEWLKLERHLKDYGWGEH